MKERVNNNHYNLKVCGLARGGSRYVSDPNAIAFVARRLIGNVKNLRQYITDIMSEIV